LFAAFEDCEGGFQFGFGFSVLGDFFVGEYGGTLVVGDGEIALEIPVVRVWKEKTGAHSGAE
jgi:hypothetical protein